MYEKSTGIIDQLLDDVPIPRMLRVRQTFRRPVIEDIPAAVREQLAREEIRRRIAPSMRIAITVGSRGIANIAAIVREISHVLRELGAQPFIVPAMGSHGGATARGQRELIESYGVTEEYCGAPIVSSMETLQVGSAEDGTPIFLDAQAARADGIIVAGRIKPHTDFRGPYESGLVKMLVVGLGKQRGAEVFHANGTGRLAEKLPVYGEIILKNAPVLFGLALLENAYDQTCRMVALPKEAMLAEEPALLEEAKALMGRIYFDPVDVLVVDKIGKDISGEGMDANITGRFATKYADGGIEALTCAVLDLTDESHGSILGLGMADITTMRVIEKANFEISYANSLTSTILLPSKVPIVMKNDRQALQACLKYCGGNDKQNPKVVRLRDTLHLEELWISEALEAQAREHPSIQVISEPEELRFDARGNLW